MVILLECFIIEIHKLIRKPGTRIHRNSDPLRHPSECHVLKYIYFIRDPACIMINLLSLNSQTDSSGKPLKKPVSAIILFQIVFLFYNSYISKANVPTTIRSSPVPDFNDSFSWNTIYENATVTRILSLSMGTITLAGPV